VCVSLTHSLSSLLWSGTLALERLHRQVLPFLLRRVKQDVLKDLPPKIIQGTEREEREGGRER